MVVRLWWLVVMFLLCFIVVEFGYCVCFWRCVLVILELLICCRWLDVVMICCDWGFFLGNVWCCFRWLVLCWLMLVLVFLLCGLVSGCWDVDWVVLSLYLLLRLYMVVFICWYEILVWLVVFCYWIWFWYCLWCRLLLCVESLNDGCI